MSSGDILLKCPNCLCYCVAKRVNLPARGWSCIECQWLQEEVPNRRSHFSRQLRLTFRSLPEYDVARVCGEQTQTPRLPLLLTSDSSMFDVASAVGSLAGRARPLAGSTEWKHRETTQGIQPSGEISVKARNGQESGVQPTSSTSIEAWADRRDAHHGERESRPHELPSLPQASPRILSESERRALKADVSNVARRQERQQQCRDVERIWGHERLGTSEDSVKFALCTPRDRSLQEAVC